MGAVKEIATEAQGIAEEVSAFVNNMNKVHEQALGEALANDHRTLQQCKMRMFVHFCRKLAEEHTRGLSDLRNEAACKLATEVVKWADKNPLPYV
jgi:hypothetical protein